MPDSTPHHLSTAHANQLVRCYLKPYRAEFSDTHTSYLLDEPGLNPLRSKIKEVPKIMIEALRFTPCLTMVYAFMERWVAEMNKFPYVEVNSVDEVPDMEDHYNVQ